MWHSTEARSAPAAGGTLRIPRGNALQLAKYSVCEKSEVTEGKTRDSRTALGCPTALVRDRERAHPALTSTCKLLAR